MNKKHKLIQLFILLFFILNVKTYCCQQKVKISLPLEFKTFWTDNSMKDVIDNQEKISTKTYWTVLSDSEGNTTYESANRRQPKTELTFLQKLVVVEIKNTMLHVMEPKTDGFPYLKANARDYGWISIDDVIPSAFPKNQINDDSDGQNYVVYNEKALCTHIIDENNKVKITDMHFYKGKATNTTNPITVRGEYPYYVFAKKGGRVLLASRSKVDITKSLVSEQICGWIDKEKVQIITNRICWEPNYGDDPAYEYNGYTLGIYTKDRTAAKVVQTGENYPKYNRQSFTVEIDRQNESFNRMYQQGTKEVLEECAHLGIVPVLILGNPNKKRAEMLAEVDGLREQIRNINILFVIDATSSMEHYFGSAAEAVTESMKDLKVKLANSDYIESLNFSAAVYRDVDDGEKIFDDYHGFTSKSQDIINYLESVECKSEGDSPEAVFQGLIKSLKKFKGKKDQKNIIIWIGDAGNRRENVASNISEIRKLSMDYNVNWSIFQIRSDQEYDFYTDFKTDANQIIKGVAEDVLGKMNKKLNEGPEMKRFRDDKDKTLEVELDIYPDKEENGGYILFVNYLKPRNDGTISPTTIKGKIVTVINNMYVNTKKELEITGGDEIVIDGNKVSLQSEPMYDWLLRKGYSLDEIKILSKKSFRVKGYLPIKIAEVEANTGINAARQVVMLTSQELEDKKEMMAELVEAIDGTDLRGKLLEVFVKNMILITGNKLDENNEELEGVIYGMTFDELWLSLFGVNFNHTYDRIDVKKMQINLLSESEDISDAWVKSFSKKISSSYKDLKEIDPEDYPYKRKTGLKSTNGDNYFLYIPREFFP